VPTSSLCSKKWQNKKLIPNDLSWEAQKMNPIRMEESLVEIMECCVCLNGTYDTLPCGHVVCEECQPKMVRCPMCRQAYPSLTIGEVVATRTTTPPTTYSQWMSDVEKRWYFLIFATLSLSSTITGIYCMKNNQYVLGGMLFTFGMGSVVVCGIVSIVHVNARLLMMGIGCFYGMMLCLCGIFGFIHSVEVSTKEEKNRRVAYGFLLYLGLSAIFYPCYHQHRNPQSIR